MKFCVYQYSTEDAYCEKLVLIYFLICSYSYPYISILQWNVSPRFSVHFSAGL